MAYKIKQYRIKGNLLEVDEKLKGLYAATETSGDISGDYLQLERSTFEDLKRRGRVPEDIEFEGLSTRSSEYDTAAKAYTKDLMETFKIPTAKEAALWSYRPGWYQKYGGRIENIPEDVPGSFGKSGRQVMMDRQKNIVQHLNELPKEDPKRRTLADIVSKGVKAALFAPFKAVSPLKEPYERAKPYLPIVGEKYENLMSEARERVFGTRSFEKVMRKAPDLAAFGIPPLTPFLKEEAKFRKTLIGTTADIYTRPDVLLHILTRSVRPVMQARALSKMEKAVGAFEKAGTKFPSEWTTRQKAVSILGQAQVDPKVGDVVKTILDRYTYVYGGGPSTKQIASLAKQFKLTGAQVKSIKQGLYAGLPAQVVSAIQKLKPAVTPELQPLAEEAKKYKSAEEFIKSQNLQKAREENVFTRPEFFDKGKVGISNSLESFSSERPLLAENKLRKSVVYRDKTGKPQGVLSFNITKEGKIDTEGHPEIFVNPNFRRQGIATKLRNKAKELGYDISSVKDRSFTESGMKFEKSQLTDFYNQATGKVEPAKAHIMPSGEVMPGPEHKGALPGSEFDPTKIKEPYKYTKATYIKEMLKGPRGKLRDPIALERYHKRNVEEAISQGKTLPPAVLKDYPELAPPEEDLFAGPGVEMGLTAKEINKEALKAELEKTGYSAEEVRNMKEVMSDYKKELFKAIKDLGGIKPHLEEDKRLPLHLKNKKGQALDDMVSQLKGYGFSFDSEDALRQAILEEAATKEDLFDALLKATKIKRDWSEQFRGAGIKPGKVTIDQAGQALRRISAEAIKIPFNVQNIATEAQRTLANMIAKRKRLTPNQTKRLAKVFTGKATMRVPETAEEAMAWHRKGIEPMTQLEASEVIQALKGIARSRRPGKPPTLPTTKALTPPGFFQQKFREPTFAKFPTPSDRYMYVLGLQDILDPSLQAKLKMDAEKRLIFNWMDKLESDFIKSSKTSFKEKIVTKLKNVPSKAHVRMWDWLNTPGMTLELVPEPDRPTYIALRKLTDSMIARANEVLEKMGFEPIQYMDGYVRWIYEARATQEIKEKHPFPPDLEYYMKLIHPKHVFNPTALERLGHTEGLLRDPFKAIKAMVSSDLKSIYLTQPNILYKEQLEALSKTGVMEASTRQWAEDFMNIVIKKHPSPADKLIDRSLETLKIPQVMNWFLEPFGRTWGPSSIRNIAGGVGRLVHDALIWGKLKLVIRNHTQKLLGHGLYGSKAFAKAFLPENKQLKYFIDSSDFYKASKSTYMEVLPQDVLGRLEQIGFAPYGHSHAGRVGGNVPFTMKVAYHAGMELVNDPKYAKYGWTVKDVIKEMDYGANTAQYWYNMVGMPELYRHKILGMFAKLQSWWMNYTFKYWREMLHRGFTGQTGWGKPIPPKWRVAAIRHIIGSVIFVEGLRRAFGLDYRQIALLGILPTYLSPVGQVALSLYQLLTAKDDYQKEQAKRNLKYSYKAFIPGSGAWKQVADVWSGDKPIKSLFFHTERVEKSEYKISDKYKLKGGDYEIKELQLTF